VLVWAGTATGTRLARVEPEVRRYAWYGFLSQAGVTLALATLVARAFPTWGAEIQVIIVAMIALHELIGPIGFQYALRRAGEAGAARVVEDEPPPHAPAAPSPASDLSRPQRRPPDPAP
jgi:hypothetical protein